LRIEVRTRPIPFIQQNPSPTKMFFHAMHLLNHPVAAEMGRTGLSFAQTCPFAGVKDFGTLCTCANRADSCPEPTIIGTTHGFNVNLPMLGVKSEAKAFLSKYPNYAYLVRFTRQLAVF
jgi:hypothetical protein